TDPDPLPECGDGEDNDRDGAADYPLDPDCEAAGDEEEATPPACRDQRDNDADGLIDLFDPGCEGDPEGRDEYNLPACRDGLDNDEDGLIDFPYEPGCTDRDDPREEDPSPPAQCSDGLDNDGDGLTDYPTDTGSCVSAADPLEDNPCPRRRPREITGLALTRGTSAEKPLDFLGSCGGDGPEDYLLWRVAPDRPLRSIRFSTRNSDIDTVLYLRSSCDGEELGCVNEAGFRQTESLEFGPLAGGEALHLFVDERSGEGGIWRLQIDARLDEGARCDGEGWRCADDFLCLESLEDGFRCRRPACRDFQDNDGDGLTDYPNDPGCATANGQSENDPLEAPECADNVDDDGDGLIDFGEDPDCESAGDPSESPACSDQIDNDGDGLLDFGPEGDPGCSCAGDPSEGPSTVCGDGCDNDGDGLIDLADPGCEGPEDDDEYHTPQCQDEIDNDGDGQIDFPNDDGCPSPVTSIEGNPDPRPQCADEEDNDEDDLIDYPLDSGCQSAADTDERGRCELPIPIIPEAGVARGDTSDASNEATLSCTFGQSPDAHWRIELPYPARLDARLQSESPDYQPTLGLRDQCGALRPCEDEGCEPESSELACDRAPARGGAAELSLDGAVGTLYLVVDGFGAGTGPYTLQVSARYPLNAVCGPLSHPLARCADGLSCLAADEGAPPTCQLDEAPGGE
ncbi:MAG: hypothetical protein VYD19_08090, partial [Myxococcota bacterium]|nr:hypothetical protein [Myxococcota bacterium]